MEIKIYADELFNTIEDLRTVLDCTGDQSITIEVREDADEHMHVFVRALGLTGNLAELKTIARDTSGSGTVSFRYCEISKIAFAYGHRAITITSASQASRATIAVGDGTILLDKVEDVPAISSPTAEDSRASFDTCDLLHVVQNVMHAQSEDHICRPSLCGVQVEIAADMKLRAIATDGRRMAVSSCQVKRAELKTPSFSAFLPAKACQFLLTLQFHGAMTSIVVFGNHARVGIETGGSSGYFDTNESTFPDWQKCVPKDPPFLCSFYTLDMHSALHRAILALTRTELCQPDEDDPDGEVTVENSPLVAIISHTIGSSELELTVEDAEDPERPKFLTTVKCNGTGGAAFSSLLNARFLYRMLCVMGGTVEVSAGKLERTEQLGPHLFKCSELPDFFEVIMPLRGA